MKTPISFVDFADEEAYNKALKRLISDYCGRGYSTYASLYDPIEVYSFKRSVKRWIVVCRFCSVLIHLHETKKRTKKEEKKNVDTTNNFFLEDPTLYRGDEDEEDPNELEFYEDDSEEDLLPIKEDHEF
jgi:hypothetical protein